jgi:hypothetical protein
MYDDHNAHQKIANLFNTEESRHIIFMRFYAIGAHDMLISVDHVEEDRPFYLVELKTYSNVKLMARAMRFIMQEFPVVQTTYGKSEIVS